MDIRKLQRAIVDGLEDVKAQHIVVFNTEHLSPLFERVIIASGTSNRQTRALASSVRDAVKTAGLPVLATEGGDNGEWIIVDCGPAVAHIMQPSIRDYYRLEEIWGGKPVKMKIAADAPKGLVKATAEPEPTDGKKAAVKKTAARKGAASGARSKAMPAAAKKTTPGRSQTASGSSTQGRPSKSGAAAKPLSARQAGLSKPTKPATKTASRAAPRSTGAKRPAVTAAKRSTAGTAPKRAAGSTAGKTRVRG